MRAREGGGYVLLTALAMLVAGYHPGLEDDAYYLAAIRRDLDPRLFPHDADFFRLQFQATIFDRLIAWSVRLTHLPLEWALLVWQFAAVFLILWACGRLAGKCFREPHARWAAVALVAALLTIPVSGTGISLVDQYLHPRALATAAILWAVVATLDGRRATAAVLLALAASLHVIMAAFGVSCCIFLAGRRALTGHPAWKTAGVVAMALPLGWVFDPVSPAWERAAATRTYYFPMNWEWYEWLGVVAPLVLLWGFYRIARRDGSPVLARVAWRVLWFGAFQMAVGLAITLPNRLERLRPFEPMRYLQLVYLFLFLLGGGLLGKYVLRARAWRWAAFFVPLSFGMLYAQRQMYPATTHLELPGINSGNEWVRAFHWVRNNTPRESLFALDPRYMGIPGEDFHGFRAIAARSALADNLKDPGMVARVPRLANRWQAESNAQFHWNSFQADDFRRLKSRFGVGWVVFAKPGVAGLTCPWRDADVLVCRID
jgi:hypothetical protein